MIRALSLAAVMAALSTPVLSGDITVMDPYARSASPAAKSGAAFMHILNPGPEDDRLIAARTPAAKRVELHTHKEIGDGVMQMLEVEEGFPVPAGGKAMLARGGDHVMLMGLTAPLKDGDSLSLTLVFETAGEITIEVPVDLKRQPKGGGHGGMQKTN